MALGEPSFMSGFMPPPYALRKRSRLDRLSSFFPSLITQAFAELPPGPSVHRKPIPNESPIQDKAPFLPGPPPTSSHGESWLNPLSSDSPGLNGGLLLDPLNDQRQPSDATHTKMKLQKSLPPNPPVPANAPPPVPAKRLDPTSPPSQGPPSQKLTKQSSSQRRRSNSLQNGSHRPTPSQSGLAPHQPSHSPEPRGRSSSAHPPSNRLGSAGGNRVVSAAAAVEGSRPGSSNGSQSPTREGEKRGRLRRSWLPGNRSRSTSQGLKGGHGTGAWTLGQTTADYNTSFLASGEKVPELWNENGNVLVYLHAKGSGLGPSFKVPAFVTDYSLVFRDLIEAELASPVSARSRARSFTGRDSLSVSDARRQLHSPPTSPPLSGTQTPGESKLYLFDSMQPGRASQPDLERLISIRNMFAFLTGQPLVGTKAQPSLFAVLMRVSSLLSEFEFTNMDGSTFGDAVEMSFAFFMDQMAIADVRHSREKTLEALVLGERMRSWDLYSEAFAHAVGKYTAIRDLHSPLWEQVSSHTRERLERGHLDLLSRQNSVNNRLESFEFPSLFSGVANSTSTYKNVRFNIWRKSFSRMRSFVLSYYKSNFGSWPPKARSKKNPFSESGLNRQVLKILYSDLCALYDLMVDRESITPRVIDQTVEEITDDEGRPNVSALRKILGEFDLSSPPVLPPIPFDIPKLPDLTSVKENYYELPPKEQAWLDKNFQEYEFLLILNKSYDFDMMKLKIPFLEDFKEFERKEAKGKPISEMADQRIGYWLFLYVVIQSLPMLVVDAPGLKFTEGVEYFLCQPPKGHAPWLGGAPEVRKRWYEAPGGTGYVELSEDAVQFSVEGIYHRSHCWMAAKSWTEGTGSVPPQGSLSPLHAPQSVFADMDPRGASPSSVDRSESPPVGVSPQVALRPRNASPAARHGYRSSIALGLEPVLMPPEGYSSDQRGSRVFSSRDSLPGSRPQSAMMGKSRSSGNLRGMAVSTASAHSRSSSRQDSPGGSTFDDILKDIDTKPKKKKTFFG